MSNQAQGADGAGTKTANWRDLLVTAVAALDDCDALFAEIRDDWSDPRNECREGRAKAEQGKLAIISAIAALCTPAPATPPGVPDSLRALSEAATPGDATFEIVPYHLGDTGNADLPGFLRLGGVQIAEVHEKYGPGVDPRYEADGKFVAAAINFVRSLLATHLASLEERHETERLQRIGHAVRSVVRSAWSLCDLTEDGGEPGQDIPPTAWKQLADDIAALEALIPEEEQPASAGHAVTLLIDALASHPAGQSTGQGAFPEGGTAAMRNSAAVMNGHVAPNSTRTGDEGTVTVPVEPTEEMMAAGAPFTDDFYSVAAGVYRAMIAARPAAPEAQVLETFPKPRRKDGEPPCGECRLQPGETCDICGAVAPTASSGQERA